VTGGPVPPAILVGHPRPCSRTHAVAVRAGHLLRDRLLADGVPLAVPRLIDLADLAPGLLDQGRSAAAEDALNAVAATPLVLMASPTFRGACSGLLKLFLDMLPRYGLGATVVVPLMTAGLPAHRTAVDTTLRPVLIELGAQVPAPGISVLETELARFDDVFRDWWRQHGSCVRRAVLAQARPDRVVTC
jgi:FMN reductase